MSSPASGFEFDPEWRITLFALVMLPLMIGLGIWQLQRADEKNLLAEAWEYKQVQSPSPLSELWNKSAGSLAYLPVTVSGTFLRDEYFLLDNRILDGQFGYEVLGILRLDGSDRLALVNRGWLAGDPARLQRPAVPPVAGRVTLTGHVYVAPGAPYLLAEQQLGGGWPRLLQAIEMDKLAPAVADIAGGKLFPFTVRIDAGEPGALTVDWKIVNVSPQKHQAYAVQWFAMALVLLIFYLLRCSNLWQWLKRTDRT